jgi:glucokinase
MLLAADVGGTKTLLGLFERDGGRLRSVREAVFDSRAHPSLQAIVREFLRSGREDADSFAVGVAGPVIRGRSQVVNLRWPVDEGKLSAALTLRRVRVLNDLEATAWGVAELRSRQIVSLTPGLRGSPGNAAVIAAGTGLGMALMVWDGERFHPSASEGGHQEFAPRDDLEIELLRFMRRRHSRVSVERLVAGSGFSAIYQFLVESGRYRETAAMSHRIARAADPNAAISAAGIAGEDAAARKTLELFVSLYGSAAGDLALVARATAGVYVGGGIAPRILPGLRSGVFIQAFRNKGRLSALLEKIPVRVIVEPRAALLGAAACADRLSRSDPAFRRTKHGRSRGRRR